MKKGDTLIMPKGKTVGMGKLREATPAVIEWEDTASDGTKFYAVRYTDRKGRSRTTYYSPTHEGK
jgi:hypothetical protein